ncbi:uncharacterized protein [Temnothorax longispinosus]|uniref:uncharacterized protein n=1 Tax=Temnothorax longispinosus TaxID=300112 RepID=UPI003A9917AF
MLPGLMQHLLRKFGIRHHLVINFINLRDPGFWTDLREVAVSYNNLMSVDGGERRVREFPTTMNTATQAQPETGTAATQADGPERRDAEIQIGEPPKRWGERRVPLPEARDRRQRTCWNCQSTFHVFIDCPFKRQVFCYGCGEKGVTLLRCHRCSAAYLRRAMPNIVSQLPRDRPRSRNRSATRWRESRRALSPCNDPQLPRGRPRSHDRSATRWRESRRASSPCNDLELPRGNERRTHSRRWLRDRNMAVGRVTPGLPRKRNIRGHRTTDDSELNRRRGIRETQRDALTKYRRDSGGPSHRTVKREDESTTDSRSGSSTPKDIFF